jgi:hypothetical protein
MMVLQGDKKLVQHNQLILVLIIHGVPGLLLVRLAIITLSIASIGDNILTPFSFMKPTIIACSNWKVQKYVELCS